MRLTNYCFYSPLSIVFIILISVLSKCESRGLYIRRNLARSKPALSDHWVLQINGTYDEAKKIANEQNFQILRPIQNLDGVYLVKINNNEKRDFITNNTISVQESEKNIISNPLVKSFKKEKILIRESRDLVRDIENSVSERTSRLIKNESTFNDKYWDYLWFLNRNLKDHNSLDMNITGAWSLGYSGFGIAVAVLDDGLEWKHPDIISNFDNESSTDLVEFDDDPTPHYGSNNQNHHGTRCAGIISASANNSECTVGIAFNSKIGGIRILDGQMTDTIEAAALGFNIHKVSIYSSSWGPADNGMTLEGPSVLAQKSLINGITNGRNGLGSIYVWASGNGGKSGDSCSCDGYVNSIYTFTISSLTENSQKPWYLEECTAIIATTFSSGNSSEKQIPTTDIHSQCTVKHTGTSASAPIAAGIYALTLEANSNLTWRDVMYLTVLTSRPDVIQSNNYIRNKRGFLVSSRYGFGLMDAGRMVELAKNWENVPKLHTCSSINSKFTKMSTHRLDSTVVVIKSDACKGTINEVNYIEQVELIVTLNSDVRGFVEIYLTSPMGTESIILPRRKNDFSPDGFKDWSFLTVQLWGENPAGEWVIKVKAYEQIKFNLKDVRLVIHGTQEKPIDYNKFVKPHF